MTLQHTHFELLHVINKELQNHPEIESCNAWLDSEKVKIAIARNNLDVVKRLKKALEKHGMQINLSAVSHLSNEGWLVGEAEVKPNSPNFKRIITLRSEFRAYGYVRWT